MKTFLYIITLLLTANLTLANETEKVAAVLDELHRAASKAETETYFNLFTEDAVFIGTDVNEFWSIEQFKAFAKPYFDKGKGWTYLLKNRNIYFSKSGDSAWFHEILFNESYGTTRGTGVLSNDKETGWRISQYHLTIPIPNDLAKGLTEKIKEFEENYK